MAASPIQSFRNLISENQVAEAFSGLLDFLDTHHPLRNDIILLESRWNHLQRNELSGVLTTESANIQRNQIVNALLQYLQDLESAEKSTSSTRPAPSKTLTAQAQGLLDESQKLPDEKIAFSADELVQDIQAFEQKVADMPEREARSIGEQLLDRMDQLQQQIGDFSDSSSNPEPPSEEASASLYDVETRLESDQWAQKDLLGYEVYAEVLANMIFDEHTDPPLAIGVIAPWGHGKTTLMHYIRRRLEEGPEELPNPEKKALGETVSAQLGTWWQRFFWPRHRQLKARLTAPDNWQSLRFEEESSGWPIVWFNPWQYQSSEQIWAGMAHALIRQLAERLKPREREAFYFLLHLRRVDQQAIRQDIYRSVLLRLVPNLLILLLSAVVYFALITTAPALQDLTIVALSGTPALLAIANGLRGFWKATHEEADEKYNQYFQQPQYTEKLGMYHDVNEDLQRVFELLVDQKQPVVIFIDDLDRCSPKRVAEVIEAINLLMNGDYRDKCYFVLGMDAQVVAAALDVSYKDMYGRLGDRTKAAGSIGWYFLDKFIQLPFFIPTLDDPEKEVYLHKLFSQPDTELPPRPGDSSDPDKMKREAKAQVERARRGESSPVTIQSRAAKVQMDRYFIQEALAQNHDSAEILGQLKIYARFLEDSPRGLKRFANLLRFYTAIQQLRIRDGAPYASTEALAKWLTISLRWPQFVRWLQWSREEYQLSVGSEKEQPDKLDNAIYGMSPREKAAYLDQLIRQMPRKIDPNDQQLRQIFENDWQQEVKDLPHVPGLSDIELFEILYRQHSGNAPLVKAVDLHIW